METEQDKKNTQEQSQAHEEEKDSSTKHFLMLAAAVIILTIVVLSFRLLAPQPGPETVTYNGFKFENYAGLWNTQWEKDRQLYNLRLHYNPLQVENITVSGDDEWFATEQTYITFDPAESGLEYTALSATELSLSLVNTFDVAPVAACTSNTTEACSERPIITCRESNSNLSVIYIKTDDKPGIELRGNCATVKGRGEDLIRAAEKAIYQWYGIIRPKG
ncbi:hypothetical protein HY640_03775 [Candidatus Woesearchaeota archaeon]|nr:hypothetical protein [Candidatus Woesearchaeota archaeon]